MKNEEIADTLFQTAQMLELADENRFRIRAYNNAAQTLWNLTQDIEDLLKKGTLTELPGIGKGIAEKIEEYCTTGKMKEQEKLHKQFPSGLLEIMNLSGLGPKRTRFLFEKLKIDSVRKLQEAARNHKLRSLEGFGQKIEENILKGILFQKEASKRMLRWEAMQVASSIVSELQKQCRSLEKIVPAGSLRRCKETVGELDFLCASANTNEIAQAFVRLQGIKRILAQGDTKVSIVYRQGLQCDLRIVKADSFGAALLYFTGSKEHNVALRELALKKGLTINEYGLYSLTNKKKPVACRKEEEIYEKLGLEYIPPELRENRGEIEAASVKKLPKLIEEKDIRGDFHNHTHLSDGKNSLEEMAQRAKDKGWGWFVSADHSQSLKVAHGLGTETLFRKKSAITKFNKTQKGFKVLLGSEVDILSDGQMDYDDETLRQIDFVVASIHSGFSQNEEKITQRLLCAIKNPHVDIIGHLTGRLIGTREPYPVSVQEVLNEADRTQTAMEINGQPQRTDLNDVHAKAACLSGVPIVLSTDAHSAGQLDFMSMAVATARRAWLTRKDILNCLDIEQLMDWKRA